MYLLARDRISRRSIVYIFPLEEMGQDDADNKKVKKFHCIILNNDLYNTISLSLRGGGGGGNAVLKLNDPEVSDPHR